MKLKHILENQRSVLDYLARYIVQELWINCKTDIIHFPLAWKNCSQEEFEKKLNKKFPSLDKLNSNIYDFLIWIQGFGQSPNLFQEFSRISNYTKHENLLEQNISEFQNAQIMYDNKILMIIGEKGYQSLSIWGTLRFNVGNDIMLSIRWPQFIDKNTIELTNADPGLWINNLKYFDYWIENCSFSVMSFIQSINWNINITVQKIFSLI